MDKAQKKVLTAAWKNRHPEAGVVSLCCPETGEKFLAAARDTATWFNRHRFELESGTHRNRRLQELWRQYGEKGFSFATVSVLDYKEGEEVSARDLQELLSLCLAEDSLAAKL